MRDLTVGMQAAVAGAFVPAAVLAEFDFDSGVVYAWTGVGDITWNGNTYKGLGDLANFSSYTETENLQAEGLVFSLSGINPALVSVALQENYQGRYCRLWLAVMADDTGLTFMADPYLLFTGLMDIMEISDTGKEASIKLSAENVLALLKRSKETRYTPEYQKSRYPGDLGLDFINQLIDKQVIWGR